MSVLYRQTLGLLAHLHEGAVADDFVGEDQVPERRNGDGAQQAVHAELPGLLALTGAGVDAGHEEDDVEGRERVEDLGLSVRQLGVGRLPTLRVKFQRCWASLVPLVVKMSR
jgi:hypothetical protein